MRARRCIETQTALQNGRTHNSSDTKDRTWRRYLTVIEIPQDKSQLDDLFSLEISLSLEEEEEEEEIEKEETLEREKQQGSIQRDTCLKIPLRYNYGYMYVCIRSER